MTVFDNLPKRKNGTKITPWDKDWTNNVRQGVYDATWGRVGIDAPGKATFSVPEPIKTGEKVPGGLMMMFQTDGYKKHFAKLYERIDRQYGIFERTE